MFHRVASTLTAALIGLTALLTAQALPGAAGHHHSQASVSAGDDHWPHP
jgi:hypothetical protein